MAKLFKVVADHPVTLPDGMGLPGEFVELAPADAAPLVEDGHLIAATTPRTDDAPSKEK